MKAKDFDLNDSLGHLINALSLRMKHQLDASLKGRDLTVHQFGILLLISKKGALSQKEIANQTNGDEPATARLMNRLEEKKYVRRDIDTLDKRKKIVSLTKDGEILLDEILPYAQAINDRLTAVLSQEEKEELFGLLTKILGASDRKI